MYDPVGLAIRHFTRSCTRADVSGHLHVRLLDMTSTDNPYTLKRILPRKLHDRWLSHFRPEDAGTHDDPVPPNLDKPLDGIDTQLPPGYGVIEEELDEDEDYLDDNLDAMLLPAEPSAGYICITGTVLDAEDANA